MAQSVDGFYPPDQRYLAVLRRSPSPSSFRFHLHSTFEFYILLKGNIKIHLENLYFDVNPGGFYIYPPNTPHGLLSHDNTPYERMFFNVEPELLGRIALGEQSLLRLFQRAVDDRRLFHELPPEDIARLREIILRMDALSRSAAFLDEIERYNLLVQALLILARAVEQQRDLPKVQHYETHPFMGTVLAYIHSHYLEPISLESVAKAASVSKYHLAHEFKRLSRTSVMNYVIGMRLTYAMQLIRRGVSPTDACFQSGFSDYSNYLKAFRLQFGASPRHFTGQKAELPL